MFLKVNHLCVHTGATSRTTIVATKKQLLKFIPSDSFP